MINIRYVVITPARNEAPYLRGTIDSMARQTIQPAQWLIVDDGSTDDTAAIIEDAARKHLWITLVRRRDRGFRKSGGGVVEAFYDGYAHVREPAWDFIVKLDADVTFEPDYFAVCFSKFASDATLGIAGGTILVKGNGTVKVDSPGDPPFHVRGATKIYRRSCWEQISPLVPAPGWDTIDEVRANMHGWTTRTFADVPMIQHRATGASDGEWRNWYKNGLANYVTGYHPLFMLAKCVKRAFRRPPVASLALGAGFCSGYLKRVPQFEDLDAVRYLRRQQLRRLMSRPSIYGQATTAKDRAGDSDGIVDPFGEPSGR
jgi:biofilm PGA synthesis N-glycosyltransferase PgaC